MNLVIDQGNTTIKTALFTNEATEPEHIERVEYFDTDYIISLLTRYDITACIYSTVSNVSDDTLSMLRTHVTDSIFFTADTPLPIKIDYLTPHTLGRDRVAAVIGAYERTKSRNALIIDAGTCITYDLLTADGHYVGGNIAPGIKMRLRAMHEHTSKLPEIEKNGAVPAIGYDTETAMRSGAIWGICHEIEGYISILQNKYPELLIFLTGGDAFLLADKLKNTIFVDESLVLKGLNRILNYNVTK